MRRYYHNQGWKGGKGYLFDDPNGTASASYTSAVSSCASPRATTGLAWFRHVMTDDERCRVAARTDNGLVALGDSAAIAFYTADLRMTNGTKTASLWALKVSFA